MIPDTPDLTNRQRVEMTTGKGTCGEACHGTLFNPLGYAFENYDAIGKYRTMDQGSRSTRPTATRSTAQLQTFTNGVELSHLLADAKETHACYMQNMMTYLHGRALIDRASSRRSTTTPGYRGPGWSPCTIWSSPS